MISYESLINKGAIKTRKNLWYISGTEEALKQDALDLVKDYVYSGGLDVSVAVFHGSYSTFNDVFDSLDRQFLKPRSLVILYEADKFSDWSRLAETLTQLPTNVFFVAVSDIFEDPTSENLSASNVSKYGAFNGKPKALHVNCTKFKKDSSIDKLLKSRLEVTTGAVNRLKTIYNGDYLWLLNQIKKLELLDGTKITEDLVNAVVTDRGRRKFCDALLRFDKKSALESADTGNVYKNDLTILAERVRIGAMYNRVTNTLGSDGFRAIQDRLGISQKRLLEVRSYAAPYDMPTATRAIVACSDTFDGITAGNIYYKRSLIARW